MVLESGKNRGYWVFTAIVSAERKTECKIALGREGIEELIESISGWLCKDENMEGKVRERAVQGRQAIGALDGYEIEKISLEWKKNSGYRGSIILLIHAVHGVLGQKVEICCADAFWSSRKCRCGSKWGRDFNNVPWSILIILVYKGRLELGFFPWISLHSSVARRILELSSSGFIESTGLKKTLPLHFRSPWTVDLF